MFFTVSNSFDYNKDSGGKTFREGPDDWEGSMTNEFAKWGNECFGKGLFWLKEKSLMRQHFRGPADRRCRGRACEEARMPGNQNEEEKGRVPRPAKS